MNTTFVLGAGFSVDAGFPLVRGLRERVLQFIEFDRHSSYDVFLQPGNGDFAQGQFYAGLEEVDSGRDLQFEELFLEFRKRLPRVNSRDPAYVTEQVLRIGCARLLWCIHGLNPFPEWCYRNLASRLARSFSSGDRSTIVSFNWDVVSEVALTEARISWSYSLSAPSQVPILKPHGSINWNGYLREKLTNDSGLWYPIVDGSRLSYMKETPLVNPDQQVINADLVYALFPGDPDLPSQDEDVARIWQDVEAALRASDLVVFIGYSFPGYDSFAAQFFEQNTKGKQVEVWNPSDTHQQRYRQLLGNRISNVGGPFSSSPYAR